MTLAHLVRKVKMTLTIVLLDPVTRGHRYADLMSKVEKDALGRKSRQQCSTTNKLEREVTKSPLRQDASAIDPIIRDRVDPS